MDLKHWNKYSIENDIIEYIYIFILIYIPKPVLVLEPRPEKNKKCRSFIYKKLYKHDITIKYLTLNRSKIPIPFLSQYENM